MKRIRSPVYTTCEVPKEVWDKPRSFCPAAQGPNTPDTVDMVSWYQQGLVTFEDASYSCAMRPGKLCRGIVDLLDQSKKRVEGPN